MKILFYISPHLRMLGQRTDALHGVDQQRVKVLVQLCDEMTIDAMIRQCKTLHLKMRKQQCVETNPKIFEIDDEVIIESCQPKFKNQCHKHSFFQTLASSSMRIFISAPAAKARV